MLDRLSQFFGQGDNQQQYQDFVQRHQDDPNSISDAEAARRYREMVQHSAPGDIDQAHAHALDQLTEQQRTDIAQNLKNAHDDPSVPWQGYPQNVPPAQVAQPQQLGRVTSQAAQQNPDMMAQVFGADSPLASTGGKLALAGVAAYLASRYLGKK
jgi:hypothetical protein